MLPQGTATNKLADIRHKGRLTLIHNKNYDDIINLPNPTSPRHLRMSLYDRAAQFSPFAALTGHDAAIHEAAKLTNNKRELEEDTLNQLNERLNIIKNNITSKEIVTITYFVPDDKKSGGSYITHSGIIKKIDEYEQTIIMTDKTQIAIKHISEIESELFKKFPF